jgi:hypothetical protein
MKCFPFLLFSLGVALFCQTQTNGETPGELPPAKFDFDRYYLALAGQPVLFSVEEMQEDFQFFRQTLEENHCCLYEYTAKPTLDSLFNEQYAKISEPMDPVAFYRILSPLTARVGCMHTSIWMAGEFWDIDPDNCFPLQVRFVQGQLVVSGSYNGLEEVPKGSILLGINDRPIFDIIGEMRTNLPSDAFNPYFIDASIEKRFPMIYARMYGFPESFEIIYVLPDMKTRKTAKLTPADIQSVRAVVFRNFQHPPLQVVYRDELSTAILTIPTFSYYDRVDYFRGFIDTVFQQIRERGIQNLVLDLRGNDGGDPFCAAPLFAYLQPEPLPYFAEPYGKYAELAQPLPLPENHFTGKLYTLLNGYCGSTNGHFCSLLDNHHIGQFVGTPSGATYTCNAGKNTEFRLPHSGMILLVGRSSFAAAVKGMDKTQAIMPDVPVIETIKDFAEGKDAFLEKALDLIEHPEQ